ncbi:MAG: GNAT family N-acetyltransferase [Bacteroidota bacterium]
MIKIELENNTKRAIEVLNRIPEFDGTLIESGINNRLINSPVILVALHNNKAIGCKVGYDRFSDGSFYSWVGGVIPEFRKQGIAQMLNSRMEEIAKEKGYTSIVFKTRNKFIPMLQFALKNGYQVVGFEKKKQVSENRIILKKKL